MDQPTKALQEEDEEMLLCLLANEPFPENFMLDDPNSSWRRAIRLKQEERCSALHYAAALGNMEIADLLLSTMQVPVNAETKDGLTPLHFAVDRSRHHGDNSTTGATVSKKMAAQLLQYKKMVEEPESSKEMVEEHESSKEMVEMLVLKYKADVNAKDRSGRTPLHEAALSGYAGSVEVLLKNGADLSARDNTTESSPLHEAARSGCSACVEALLRQGADAKAQDKKGDTPLHTAAAQGKAGVIEALVYRKAQRADRMKQAIETLRRQKQGIESTDCRNTAIVGMQAGSKLSKAKPTESEAELQEEEKEKAKADVPGKEGKKQCYNFRYRVNVKNQLGETPLHIAVECGQPEAVKALLALGADVRQKKSDGRDPLSMAIEKGFDEIGTILLENYCPDELDDDKLISIIKQHVKLDEDKFMSIINPHVEPDAADDKLMSRQRQSYLRLPDETIRMELMKPHVKKPAADDQQRKMLLHAAAAMLESTCILQYLLKKSPPSRVNSLNAKRQTPLHVATIYDNLPAVKILVNGSDLFSIIEARDKFGYTSWEYAVKCKDSQRLFLERADVKQILETELKRYSEVTNAILVGATLIAGVTFAGFLQPPLGFGDPYAKVQQHAGVRNFWFFNTGAFLLSIYALVGCVWSNRRGNSPV